jgi:6,7-dimethyl-8-ribityllumazine synthase
MKTIEGKLIAENISIAVVIGRFNEFISGKLLSGAIDAWKRLGGDDNKIEIIWVPGSFEIPITAKKLAASGKFDAIVCLGAVIRGATPHFDLVAGEVAKGVAAAGIDTGVPIIFGVITTDSIEQAIERAGTKSGNKGFEAVASAIEMANLFRQL